MRFETKLYNPAAQSADWLIEHFVVRTKVFQRIFEDIRSGDMKHPEQHYLVQGMRGMGKTTLLLRLKYEVERTPELNEWLIPVFFSEESYDLTSLSNLWEKLLKYLDDTLPDGGSYYKATDQFIGSDDYEQQCFKLLKDFLHQHGKKLLVLFDNFGELFLDNLDEQDSHRFREILMTCPDLRIIAASAVVLESHNDYKAPFFDFFKIIHLEGLNKAETVDLIKKLQELTGDKGFDVDAHRARIETLTVLTGGVVRTIIMIYEVLLNDGDGTALKDLEQILDRVTPLYKHRMDDLKPRQRRIMDVIAKNWDAISAKDIGDRIRDKGTPVPSKIISAQLQELEKNNLIEKRKTSTKNHLYLIKERFFNIWYLMRHGDKNAQNRVKWLTRFLEMWYNPENGGIDSFIEKYIHKLNAGSFLSSSAILIANALLEIPVITLAMQSRIIEETSKVLNEQERGELPESIVSENLTKLEFVSRNFFDEDVADSLKIVEDMKMKSRDAIFVQGFLYFKLMRYQEVIDSFLKIYSDKSSDLENFFIGYSYFALNQRNNALQFLIKAKSINKTDVWNLIGIIYFEEKSDFLNAEYYFREAADAGSPDAYLNLGRVLVRQDRFSEAIKVLLIVFELGLRSAYIFYLLGTCYYRMMDYSNAPIYLNKALALRGELGENFYFIALGYKLMISIKEKRQNDEGISIANEIYKAKYMAHVSELALMILVENDRLAEAKEIINKLEFNEMSLGILSFSTIALLAKKQYHLALSLFQKEDWNLKDRLKPMYYAVLSFLKADYADELAKMGGELQQPVDDILKKVTAYSFGKLEINAKSPT